MNLNSVHLIGRVTKKPEAKKLPSGMTVCSFGLATNHTYKDKNGQKQENAEFHNVVAFGKTADTIAEYVEQGQSLFVDGRLQTRSWEGNDGKKMYRTEIILNNFQFGEKAKGSQGNKPDTHRPAKTPEDEEYDNYNNPKNQSDDEDINPEDIPF